MALMKKLAPGGTIDQNALNDNINSELSKYNLTSKDERRVRDALVQLRDYMSAPEGKSFSVDPVAGKYTISGVGSEKFQGSPDEIKNNWLTGKLKIKDDQDAMSVAAAIYGNASKSPTLQGKPAEKSALNMQNLGDYLSSKYGNQDNFNYALNQLDTDDKRKQAVYDWSKSLINDYKNTISQNSDKYSGADLEKVEKLEQILNSNDPDKNAKWNKFVNTSFELGWSPQNFLLSQEQKDAIKQQEVQHTQKSNVDLLKEHGLSDELANTYKDFTYDPEFITEKNWGNAKWLVPYLQGTIALKSPSGKHILLKNGQPFSGGIANQKNPNYGYSWASTPEGFKLYQKEHLSQNPYWKMPEATVYDWNEVLYKRDSPLSYITPVKYHQNIDDIKNNISYNDQIITSSKNESTGIYHPSLENISDLTKAASSLRAIMAGGSHAERLQAEQEYNRLKTIFTKFGISPDKKYLSQHKEGGVLKAVSGIKMSEYKAKYGSPQKPNQLQTQGQSVTKENTVLGASNLDKAILASNLAMLAPGAVGVGAGILSTALEAYKGATDEDGWTWGDTGNLALNLGLTAASFVGLGGLKGVTTGAKLAKEVTEGAKVAGETSKVSKLFGETKNITNLAKEASLTNKASELNKSFNVVSAFAKEQGTTNKLGDVLAKANELGNVEVVNEIGKISGFAEQLSKSKQILPMITMPSATKALGIVDKVGKTAAIGNAAVHIPQAIDAGKKVLSGNIQDMTLDDANALTSVAFGLHVGAHMGKQAVAKKYGTEFTENTPANLSAEINGEQIKTTNPEILEKFKSKNPLSYKKNKEAIKSEFLEKYNSQLSEDKPKLSKEDLNKLKVVFNNSGQVIKSGINLDKGNYWLQRKGIQWAKKYNIAPEIKIPENINISKIEKEPMISFKMPENNKQVSLNAETNPLYSGANSKSVKQTYTPLNKTVSARFNKQKSRKVIRNEFGGIIKAQLGLKIENPYNNQSNSQLPYYKDLNNDWWSNNQPTQKFKDWSVGINENYFNNIKQGLNQYIKFTGSNYQVNDFNTYKKLINDPYFGPVKNYSINSLQQLQPKQIGFPEQSLNKTPLPGLTTSQLSNTGNVPTNYGGSGVLSKIPGLLKKVDSNDLANIAMFANTWATNKRVGNEQRQAVAESMYTIPYQSQQYLRIGTPYSLLANKQAGTMQSNANRIAASTSDLNKAIGIQLQGVTKANEILDKGNVQDQQRIDQLRSAQDQMNARVNAVNLETLGKNRAIASQAFSKIHQINANESLTQGTNLNNFILGEARNIPLKEYKANQKAMYEAYSDPRFKQAQLNYQNAVGDEGKKQFYDQWNSTKDLKGVVTKPWEESTQYTNWQNLIKEKQNAIRPFTDNFERLRIMQQFGQPLYKSGGTLSKQDRIEIENEKSESKRKLKDTEIAFKSILNNNQMLQKALIKVFK